MLSSLAAVRPDPEWTPFATRPQILAECRRKPQRLRRRCARRKRAAGELAAGGAPAGESSLAGEACPSQGAGRGCLFGRGGTSLLEFWMFHHSAHRGGLPPPPRVHFEYPNGNPILNAKYARKKYGRSAQSGRMTCSELVFAETQMVEQDIALLVAQHFMQRRPRRRRVERRVEELLDPCRDTSFPSRGSMHCARARRSLPVVPGRGGLSRAHGDFARDRAAFGRRAVARELRAPRPRGRRRDLGEPEIRRPAVPLTRFGRDASVGRDQ